MRTAPPGRLARWRSGWRVAARLAIGGLRSTPGRAAFTVGALAIGVALMAVGHDRGSVEATLTTIGVTVVTVTALGAARIPDPVRLRTSAMLGLVGARHSLWRRIVVVDVALSAIVAVGLGVPLGVVASEIARNSADRWPAAAVIGLMVPVAVAALVGGRGEVSLVQPTRSARRARISGTVRLLVAGVFVFCGVALPGSARSFFDLDITLIPGLILIAVGLALIAPMLLAAAGRVLARAARRPSAHLAGSLAVDRRRALGPAACLVAAGSAAVVVQAVLGAGLVAREAHRRASLSLQAGTRSDQVIVDAVAFPRLRLSNSPLPGRDSVFGGLTLDDVARLRQVAPDAIVAPLVLPVSAPGSGGQLQVGAYPLVALGVAVSVDHQIDAGSGRVALATPELLGALGLERFERDVAGGRALVLDPSVPVRNGLVALSFNDADGTRSGSASIPARVVGSTAIPTRLPAVIVAESALQSRAGIGPDRLVGGAVVRLPHPASRAEVSAVASVVPSAVVLAGSAVDVARLEDTRLDAASSVVVRTSADLIRGLLLVGLAGVVALVVGLRFAALAHRAEDDLFEVVGAPSATLRRIAAWQGALVTIVGVGLGSAVGLIGTASGIARYNSSGRDGLPPIPFDVPGPLLLGLVVLPLAGAAVGWASAGRRPAVDPVLLAERMAW